MTLRIGWFSTGRGEGSRRLLGAAVEAIRRGDLDAEIAFVFCNRERGEYEATDAFLDLVASFGIPCLTLSSRRFRRERSGALSRPGEPLPAWRAEYDREVAQLVARSASDGFDVGMLAGYMLVFTSEMSGRYPLLNLHPAEPGGPVGTWQEVTWQLIDTRAEKSGVMIHLATDELDGGPVVAHCRYSLRGPSFAPLWAALGSRSAAEVRESDGEDNALFREIRRHGSARELPFVVETLRAFATARLRIERGRVVDTDGRELPGGLDLTAEIDAVVAGELEGARS
ncbi:MAG: formyltransferase family protein [Dehalococcoidia bacterium]